MTRSEKLIRLRKGQSLSQAELADRMEVSRQTISAWETGRVVPSAAMIKKLGSLYGVPADYLLFDEAELPAFPRLPQAEPSDPKRQGRNWGRWLAVGLCLAVLLQFMMLWATKRPAEPSVPMQEIERGEIETDRTNDFSLDF